MRQTIHPVGGEDYRTGALKGYLFRAIDCKEGWVITYSTAESNGPTRTLWLGGPFESPSFCSVAPFEINGHAEVEIEIEPIEITAEDRSALLAICWHWEIWEPTAMKGTCAIDSLEQMIELPQEVILDWFRTTGRNPSTLEDIVITLEEKGYRVDVAGPEGFGKFHDYRRLVFCSARTIRRKVTPYSSTKTTPAYSTLQDSSRKWATSSGRTLSDTTGAGVEDREKGRMIVLNPAWATFCKGTKCRILFSFKTTKSPSRAAELGSSHMSAE